MRPGSHAQSFSIEAMNLVLQALRDLADPATEYTQAGETYRVITRGKMALSRQVAERAYYSEGTCKVIIALLVRQGFLETGLVRRKKTRWVKMNGEPSHP